MEVERVVYSKNPLVEVVCQLSYPRFLAIDEKLPSDFQTVVREKYPLLKIETINNLHFNLEEGTSHFQQPVQLLQTVYNFISFDQKWSIALCSDYVLLRTSEYKKWESFQERLSEVIGWIDLVYKIRDFSRIGLRYIDFIDRSQIGLDDVPWSELIEGFALGGMFAFGDKEDALEYHANYLFSLSHCRVRLQFLLAQRLLHGKVQDDKMGFVIDGDYFRDAVDGVLINEPINAIAEFRAVPYRMFRRCIKDKLHSAMEPRPV